jgi:RNA polymerase sigma-70 factor (ECF subfamily)
VIAVSFASSLRRWFVPPSLGSRAAAAGNERLLGIIRQHLDPLYRTARRLGVREADIEDVAQDVLLVILRRLEDIEPDKERAFVVGVTTRVVQSRHRHRRRHPEDRHETLDELGSEQAIGPAWQKLAQHGTPEGERRVERSRQLALLQAALEEMTDAQRAVFVLFELEELSAREVGEQLGLSEGTVVSRVRRAREVFWRKQARAADGNDALGTCELERDPDGAAS